MADERGGEFSLRVCPLIGQPCSGRWPLAKEYTGRTNWRVCTLEMRIQIKGIMKRINLKGVEGWEGTMINMHCMNY